MRKLLKEAFTTVTAAFVLVVLAIGLVEFSKPAKANVPFKAIDSCVVEATDPGDTIANLMVAAGCNVVLPLSTNTAECAKVANDKAALVCLGPSAVGLDALAGTQCYPVCFGGADCAEQSVSVPYKINNTYLRAPAPTKVYLLLGNGC